MDATPGVECPPASGERLLRVKNSSHANSLASALAHASSAEQVPVLRAIGAGSVNQAVKAMAIAQTFVAERGLVLSFRPGFATVTVPDGDSVTAIVMRVLTQ